MSLDKILSGVKKLVVGTGLALTIAGCSGSSNKNECVTDTDCPGNEICVGNVCGSYANNDGNYSDSIKEEMLGDLSVKHAKTNQDGKVNFVDRQTSENVQISVENENGNPVSKADVIFWDGDGFETFQAIHEDYTPTFHVFEHNSFHDLIMSGASYGCKTLSGSINNDSKLAAKKFSNKLREVGKQQGIVYKDELQNALDDKTNAIIDLSNYAGDISNLVKPLLLCSKTAVVDIPRSFFDGAECDAYNTYLANPHDLVQGRGNLSPILGISGCVENDGNNNDTNCYNECEYSGETTCDSTSLFRECGNYDSDTCLEWSNPQNCGTDSYCNLGSCVDEEPTCTTRSSEICYNDDVYWVNSCGERESRKENCASDEYCDNARCIEEIVSCTDDCDTNREVTCFGNGTRQCGDYDSDNCLEWGEIVECESLLCIDNSCYSRWTDSENGTIRDHETGLTWEKGHSEGCTTWNRGVTYCDELNLAGNTNWRMPTHNELTALLLEQSVGGCYFTPLFENCFYVYWTSTETSDGSEVLQISGANGRTDSDDRNGCWFQEVAKCVRP